MVIDQRLQSSPYYAIAKRAKERRRKKVLNLDFSTQNQIATIKGALYGRYHEVEFLQLRRQVKAHLRYGEPVRIYLHLTDIDRKGITLLFSLAKMINMIPKIGQVSVHWSVEQGSGLYTVAQDFGDIFKCHFTVWEREMIKPVC